jgi:hypothetical protein
MITTEIQALSASTWMACVVRLSLRHSSMKALLTAENRRFRDRVSIIRVLLYQKHKRNLANDGRRGGGAKPAMGIRNFILQRRQI